MKNTGKCPKCGGASIWVRRGGVGADWSAMFIGMFRHPIHVDRHCCVDCGYVEEWISDSDKEALKQAKERNG